MNNPQILKFKVVHEELQSLMSQEEIDEQLLQSKIMRYIALITQQSHPEYQEHPFDYFCEHNGVALLSKLLKVNSLIAIKAYSLLFINLKNEIWANFILCQTFVMDAIQTKCDNFEQEWTEYYISLLKSLSIRIGNTQISVFYNKKSCTFPLVFQAMKYFNHPDFMVRTSVMNIILQLMKIQQQKTRQYFSRFPFTSYLLTFACEVHSLIHKYNSKLTNQLQHATLTAKALESYSVDLSDYLYYFNDLIAFATPITAQIIRHAFMVYITLPLLRMLAGGNRVELKHALLVLTQCLKIIKDKSILQTVVLMLLRSRLPRGLADQATHKGEVHIPQVYRQQFDPNDFYWSKYRNDIVGHCLQVFDHIERFEVEYEGRQHQTTPQFAAEVQRMSGFVHFELLKNQADKEFERQLGALVNPNAEKGQFVENPFRECLLAHLKEQGMLAPILDLIIQIFQNKQISKLTLMLCEIQRLSIELKYIEECEIHLSHFEKQLKHTFLQRLLVIDWKATSIRQLELMTRIMRMLNDEVYGQELEDQFYKKCKEIAALLMTYVTKENINELVEHFQAQYYAVKERMCSEVLSCEIPFAAGLLPVQLWAEKYEEMGLPNNLRGFIKHHIQQFWYFRGLSNFYFEHFYDPEYVDFSQQYEKYFEQSTWLLGQKYRVKKTKTISCDFLQKPMKKPKKVTILQDGDMFVLAQPQESEIEYKILVNVSWIKVSFEMKRQECTVLQASVRQGQKTDRFNLMFEDQVRSSKVLANFNDLRWRRYEKELSFIYRFMQQVVHQQ